VAELKSSELDAGSDSYSKKEKGKHIIDVEPSVILTTTKVHPNGTENTEEGEHLFHSQM
jgi:hypothetical protein